MQACDTTGSERQASCSKRPRVRLSRARFLLLVPCTVLQSCTYRPREQASTNVQYAALVQRFKTGQVMLTRNPDLPRPAASVIKVLVAISLVDAEPQAAQGAVWASAAVSARSFSSRNRFFPGVHAGSEISIYWLLSRMIQQSDNFAANVLIEHLGLPQINRVAQELNLKWTRVHGLFYDADVSEMPLAYTTARECNEMMCHVLRGSRAKHNSLVAKAYSTLLEMLTNQDDRRFIPSAVPSKISVADKTGEISGQINDAAIIDPFGEDPYLFTVMASGRFGASKDARYYDACVHEIVRRVAHFYDEAMAGTHS